MLQKKRNRTHRGGSVQTRTVSKQREPKQSIQEKQNRTEQNYHTGTRREAVKESHAKPPTGRNKKSFCCDWREHKVRQGPLQVLESPNHELLQRFQLPKWSNPLPRWNFFLFPQLAVAFESQEPPSRRHKGLEKQERERERERERTRIFYLWASLGPTPTHTKSPFYHGKQF